METNFQFLAEEWADFHQRSVKAEQSVVTDPRTSLTYSRMALEIAINWMFTNDEELTLPYDTTLNSLMKQREFQEQFPHKLYNEIDLIRKAGNLAIHNKQVTKADAEKIIENLFYFSRWFAQSYAQNNVDTIPMFNWELIPTEGQEALSKKDYKKVEDKFETDLGKFKSKLKQEAEKNTALASENELFKKQIEALQAQIETNKKEANTADITNHPRNEDETRKYFIDVSLREAGWDLSGSKDKEFKVQFMPKSTNVSETGYVDYVLWDDDGLPLAIVEAKKTMESATKGENQAQLYAECIEEMYGRRPVMYYSNGFETYLWDDQFYKKSRIVHGFYTKKELQTLMFRRENREDIREQPIDTTITDRAYQLRAIRSVAAHFAGNDKANGKLLGTHRAALLVLATGTGKTRISIAISKLLLEANWAKRILFLADRKSLVSQAKNNFVKLMPEHSSVNLLQEKDNVEARIAFSTYPTMMGLIDGSKEKDKRFYGVGHFDLIIVDEAHRSIYKKYQAIFDYFDALFLGLTATPIEIIDKNTYASFGLADKAPTDAYTFEEAVANKHLVPYNTIEVPTKFLRQGIHYDDLTEEEKEEFEEEILDGEEATGQEIIPANELNTWLFNKDTAIKTLQYLLDKGIKKRGGDEIGKTIIFARNRKHAQFLKNMFLELDPERYGNDYVKLITHGEPKAEEFIQRFCDEEKERLPQIAISVDMMDTGIDAPSCVNLMFYKPVKSKAKFWQMIGRGSRLRPNLFGENQDKENFLIFDLYGNFEYFKENSKGIETGSQKSLTEIVFSLKLQLALYLKEDNFKEDHELQEYSERLLNELYNSIIELNKERFDVKMKIETVMDFSKREVWNHLDKKECKTILDILAPLVRSSKADSDTARFYDKMIYTLMIERVETPNTEEFLATLNVPITKAAIISKKLLKKTSIPEIIDNLEIVKLPLDEDFWKSSGLNHLEKIRAGIRELVKYMDPVDQRYVTTNFEDAILEAEIITSAFGEEKSESYTNPFANNTHRLEEIIRENKNNITIGRIQNGEPITEEELKSLEKLLFSNKIQKEQVEKEIGHRLDLVAFIVGLIGLSPEKVNASFADFINKYQLTAVQIQFLDTIKLFLTNNGKIDPSKLYDSPFKSYHSLGIDGVFNEEQSTNIFGILDTYNRNNLG
ncbi:DEAD/DEAH box helicase family protein [Flavobacterium sp. TAB 87]|uniref:DEAD/DEAH box helicase family protein n=1 Tax=Flavobacterium sp. TAB 87 TaxID=1729581 RepID=UPI00076C10CB|nr:DEAD/DEAH box helicase family protein [Flavobacterium sp. TAB 87]KVV16029.1 type I restriction enzyme EcoKI subunit R [Flavobacterium sp. TAB 87]